MFWKEKSLIQLSAAEWESLCDGCGKCCLVKLEDPDTFEVAYTACSCSLLDIEKVQCQKYENRFEAVPECLKITPENIEKLDYLPSSCAYRLVAKGEDLPEWHHLISGDLGLVHSLGKSVADWCVPINQVDEDDLVDMIVEIED
ncbi:hypothetical protein BIY24_07475 [Halobacteriovorax marinus]|uniref:YcgN family cysteine cluster protein n=1 Tax=Halobacteriovorax marinus TaxID=97084 RepID=UPI000BC3293D|nr:YcgN family cysteine cluster protein [Halobacteriovorax marinus]ATH07792.1 hypothetical protein BIY24_07475 [Halobacteriovorax marinus]